MVDLTSTKDASQIDLTLFPCKLCTLPSEEITGLTFDHAVERIAPAAGPRLVHDKDRVEYYLPCALRDAPMKGKTASRFPPGHVGKMRSAQHVTEGALLSPDLDDVAEDFVAATLEALRAAGVAFAAFSSWSHGLKPGHRTRFLLGLDRPLGMAEYARAYDAVNERLFGGKADPANRHLYQQAGCWSAAPDRAELAFRLAGAGRLLSADALLEIAPAREKSRAPSRVIPVGVNLDEAERERVLEAVFEVDPPDDYDEWLAAVAGIRGAVELGRIDAETGRALWLWHSGRAAAACQATNDDPRYDPACLWERDFDAPAEARIGRLFGLVADQAIARIKHAIRVGTLDAASHRARGYLWKYHAARLDALLMEYQAREQ